MLYSDTPLHLVYQPIIDLAQPEQACAEALLRGMGEDGRIILPGKIIAQAELSGRILALDQWVAETTIHWLAEQVKSVTKLGFVSINLSAHSLNDTPTRESILQSIESAPPEARTHLCVELTETARIADMNLAWQVVRYLQSRDVKVALDDYGTGFANASVLQYLPVDIVKLSGELVQNVLFCQRSRDVVEQTIVMVNKLGAACVAEKVESDSHADMLCAFGVRYRHRAA